MGLIEKLYTVIIFIAVMIGLIIGQIDFIQSNAESLIVPLIMAMLTITFLQMPIEDIRAAFKNRKFTYTSVLINFVWTPILSWLLALLFLGDTPALYIGFIMLMITPCTDWYLIFTGIAKGNVALSTAILPVNLILQVILLPIYLLVFGGTTGAIQFPILLESIVTALLIPFILSFLIKMLVRNKQQLKDRLLSKINNLPIIFLGLAIMAMFASQGQLLVTHLDLLWRITIPILLFFIINFFVSQKVGHFLKFPIADGKSLSMTTLARNSPTALAIAMTAFPNEPLIPLTLVVGPLLELPLLAIVTQMLIGISKKPNAIT
ncbi:arsenic resistance protein [Sporosarcina contaminans]|uniref:Arsenic resistance protein n=1 Tax=Sporosarcina contaminans TaxID=633403 RepID=A0ABW3TWW2_9BACL